MPQLDYYIFISQLIWLGIVLVGVYLWISGQVLPMLYELWVVRTRLKEWENVEELKSINLKGASLSEFSMVYQGKYSPSIKLEKKYKLKK